MIGRKMQWSVLVFMGLYLVTGASWGDTPDVNADGTVNEQDIFSLMSAWHQTVAVPQSPLPSGAIIMTSSATAPQDYTFTGQAMSTGSDSWVPRASLPESMSSSAVARSEWDTLCDRRIAWR